MPFIMAMRRWGPISLILAGLVSSSALAQSLTLDPAFSAIVGGATCSKYARDGTHCYLSNSQVLPSALVTLAHASPECRPGAPWDVCKDGIGVLDAMVKRGGDRTVTLAFTYVTGGRAFLCDGNVTYLSESMLWDYQLYCEWSPPEGEKGWWVTILPLGPHLYSENGSANVSILCDRGEARLIYSPNTFEVTGHAPPSTTPVSLGLSADSPEVPPPYDVVENGEATEPFQFEIFGSGVDAFLSTIAIAQRYLDIGVQTSALSLNTELYANGSTAAVREFLENCKLNAVH